MVRAIYAINECDSDTILVTYSIQTTSRIPPLQILKEQSV